jgi:hypothetical protein
MTPKEYASYYVQELQKYPNLKETDRIKGCILKVILKLIAEGLEKPERLSAFKEQTIKWKLIRHFIGDQRIEIDAFERTVKRHYPAIGEFL